MRLCFEVRTGIRQGRKGIVRCVSVHIIRRGFSSILFVCVGFSHLVSQSVSQLVIVPPL